MNGLENNLNRDKILEINDQITRLAQNIDFEDQENKKRASARYRELVDERKALYEAGCIDDEDSVAG